MEHVAAPAGGDAPASGACDGAAAEHAGGMGTWLSHRKVLVKSAPVLCMTCAGQHRSRPAWTDAAGESGLL